MADVLYLIRHEYDSVESDCVEFDSVESDSVAVVYLDTLLLHPHLLTFYCILHIHRRISINIL